MVGHSKPAGLKNANSLAYTLAYTKVNVLYAHKGRTKTLWHDFDLGAHFMKSLTTANNPSQQSDRYLQSRTKIMRININNVSSILPHL